MNAEQPELAILNWQRFDARVTTSGQPSEADLRAIRDLGVRTVINLALHDHPRALPDERASVEALGMRYVHIPVRFDKPTEHDFQAFCDAFAATGSEPVHIHCIVNARVSAFCVRYDRDVAPLGGGAALAIMDRVWRPGGVWADFLGDLHAGADHAFAGRDY